MFRIAGLCLVVVISTSGCATVNVTEHQKVKFDKNATITVICKHGDFLGIATLLESILLSRGYDVVSLDAATSKVKSAIRISRDNNLIEADIEGYRSRELLSIYALAFTYTWVGMTIRTLHGTLIDLTTGRIVRAFDIDSIYGHTKPTLTKLVDKMEKP